MKRNAKNLVRLTSLVLAVLLFSSCAGCSFGDLFDIVVPDETDENGNPITPDGSYTNSEAQSGLVDDSTKESTEEPTEEVIVQYDAAMEEVPPASRSSLSYPERNLRLRTSVRQGRVQKSSS